MDVSAHTGVRPLLFEQDTVESLRELGVVLGSIRRRLITEGYAFENGKIYKKYENSQ